MDPMGMFRQMVDQWEKLTNEYGGKLAQTSEFAQGMQGMTAISLQIQQAVHDGMTKVLAAANMPSREDFATLAERIGRIEAQLSRIEGAGAVAASPFAAQKPSRTKKPPIKAS
jgi:hypothetical protein